jgi:ribonuclease HI
LKGNLFSLNVYHSIKFIYEYFKQNPGPCGVGGVIFISDYLSYSFRTRTSRGTNNFAEIQVILNLLKRASVKGIETPSFSGL